MSTFDNPELDDKVSIKSVAVKWGAISGAIGIVFYLFILLAGFIGSPVGYLGSVLFIVVLVLSHNEYKNQGDSFMSYGEGLKLGLVVSLIGGAILAIFSFIYGEFIDPTVADQIKDIMIAEWEKQGMSDEQIEQTLGFMSFMFNPYLGVLFVLIKNVLVGFVLSLVISAITKKNNPELEV